MTAPRFTALSYRKVSVGFSIHVCKNCIGLPDVFLCSTCMQCMSVLERESLFLELYLQMVVSRRVGAGN